MSIICVVNILAMRKNKVDKSYSVVLLNSHILSIPPLWTVLSMTGIPVNYLTLQFTIIYAHAFTLVYLNAHSTTVSTTFHCLALNMPNGRRAG